MELFYPLIFLVEFFVAALVLVLAINYLRVWWSYIMAGELVFVLGLEVVAILAFFAGHRQPNNDWFFIYGFIQGSTLLLLLACITDKVFMIVYALAGLSAVCIGYFAAEASINSGWFYFGRVFVFGCAKLGLMANYWCNIPNRRVNPRFDRIHVWQK